MSDDEPVRPATSGVPIVTGSDGQAYIGADAAVALLRAIAEACRNNVRHADDADDFAAAVDQEADNLTIRAIAHTA